MAMTKKYAAKKIHASCLLLASAALLVFPHIGNKYLLFVPMAGFGVAWASIMAVPFLIAVAEVPRERYGVYMGIINMMIVIPMLIQTVTFGAFFEYVLGGNPANAMMFAGVLLALAAFFTLRIRTRQKAGGA